MPKKIILEKVALLPNGWKYADPRFFAGMSEAQALNEYHRRYPHNGTPENYFVIRGEMWWPVVREG